MNREEDADVTSVIRGDHDDLVRQLRVLADSTTPLSKVLELFDSFRAAFAAHTFAQAVAWREVLGPAPRPRVLAMIVESLLDEHRSQARVLAALALSGPGTREWRMRANDLCVQLLDHAMREQFMRATLRDHVTEASRRGLAETYTSVRTQQLAPSLRSAS